ncbi:receptor-type tyrosine-protein phosphatase, partial [Hyalella azteca]|uniref:Receptor-type tyrosine-protein phosphatase n=1 Tax=Hyalella azteca TaxID=294128 RepID=A0A8B7MYM1_HYAAZ
FQSPTSDFRETSTEQNELATGLLQTIKQPLKDPRELTTAFAALRSRSRVAPTDEAASRPNIARNRYQDILPFNDTRVKLQGEWSTDYINASYVKDAVGSVRFIACQGPKPGTVPDFWHMVWQEQVQFIVMLTDCYEKGKEKCCMYWPETNSPAREVVQLHFTSWPDFNVPASEAALLRLISSVRARVGETESLAPILVHCSAGVGRTGTFIALWNLQQQHQRGAPIDIDATILKIREDRNLLVQSKEQYLFVRKCFSEYLRKN